MELSFEITGSEPSITPKRIKDYIADNTDLTLKPKWTVVTELREVKEDDDAAAPQAPPKPTSSAAPPVPPPPGGRADVPQAPPAPPTGSQADVSPQPPTPPAPPADVLADLVAKMNKLSPAIQAAAQANPSRKADLLKPVAAFQGHVKAKDTSAAQGALKETAALLKQLGAASSTPQPAPTPPPAPPSGQQPQAKEQSKEVEQREGEAQEKTPAEEQADRFKQDWAAARKKLRLAIDKVEEQLTGLADALLKSNDPNMVWVAEQGLTQLIGGLRASATTIDKTASKTPAKTAAFAKPAIAELEKRIESEQIKVCDQNKFGAKVSVKKTIAGAIEELVKTLETAAV
jgi:hypothetical protein